MIAVCNRIPVNPEHSAAFEEVFSKRASRVDEMPGFVAFHLMRPTHPEDPYTVMTLWESHAHFEAWTNSEEFKRGHGHAGTLPPETFLGRPKLEVFEIISSAVHRES